MPRLPRRALTGAVRPRPLRVVVVNGMSASGVPARRSLAILQRASRHADVVLGCEFANVADDDPLDPIVWEVVHDPTSSSRAGTLLAIRRTRGRVGWAAWRHGSRRGYGLRRRWLIVARLVIDPGQPHEWRPKALAGHAPPKRAWALWPGFMTNVARQRADIAGGDWNELARAVHPALGRRTRMRHILGVTHRWWIPAGPPIPLDVGADHDAVQVTLWPDR